MLKNNFKAKVPIGISIDGLFSDAQVKAWCICLIPWHYKFRAVPEAAFLSMWKSADALADKRARKRATKKVQGKRAQSITRIITRLSSALPAAGCETLVKMDGGVPLA